MKMDALTFQDSFEPRDVASAFTVPARTSSTPFHSSYHFHQFHRSTVPDTEFHYPSSPDLCGLSCNSFNSSKSIHHVPLRVASPEHYATTDICTDFSCTLLTPPLTGSEPKHTIHLPLLHDHVATSKHHNAGRPRRIMQNGDFSFYPPPSPPLTSPLSHQALPDTGDWTSLSTNSDSRQSSSRHLYISTGESTSQDLSAQAYASSELLTPLSFDWHFPRAPALDAVSQDTSFPDSAQAPYILYSPSTEPASLPPENVESWEARRFRQPDTRWFDDESDDQLLRPPESPRLNSKSLDSETDNDVVFSTSRRELDDAQRTLSPILADNDCSFSAGPESFMVNQTGNEERRDPSSFHSSHLSRLNYDSPFAGVRPIMTTPDSEDSLSTLDSTAPAEDDEFTASLSAPWRPPVPRTIHFANVPSSPSRRSVALLPDEDDPYCPTPLTTSFASPSRRSCSSLPEFESPEADAYEPTFPRHGLLSFPGGETDEELLPPSPSSSSSASSQQGLLLTNVPPYDLVQTSPQDFNIQLHVPPELQSHTDILRLYELRKRYYVAERAARRLEEDLAVRVDDLGAELLSHSQGQLWTESMGAWMGAWRRELKAAKDRQAVVKRLRKKEKDRGREISTLLKLKLAEANQWRSGGCGGDSVCAGECGGAKGRESCGRAVFDSISQLVSKMVFKRRESYRPLTNRRVNPHQRGRSGLSQSVIIADSEEGQ